MKYSFFKMLCIMAGCALPLSLGAVSNEQYGRIGDLINQLNQDKVQPADIWTRIKAINLKAKTDFNDSRAKQVNELAIKKLNEAGFYVPAGTILATLKTNPAATAGGKMPSPVIAGPGGTPKGGGIRPIRSDEPIQGEPISIDVTGGQREPLTEYQRDAVVALYDEILNREVYPKDVYPRIRLLDISSRQRNDIDVARLNQEALRFLRARGYALDVTDLFSLTANPVSTGTGQQIGGQQQGVPTSINAEIVAGMADADLRRYKDLLIHLITNNLLGNNDQAKYQEPGASTENVRTVAEILEKYGYKYWIKNKNSFEDTNLFKEVLTLNLFLYYIFIAQVLVDISDQDDKNLYFTLNGGGSLIVHRYQLGFDAETVFQLLNEIITVQKTIAAENVQDPLEGINKILPSYDLVAFNKKLSGAVKKIMDTLNYFSDFTNAARDGNITSITRMLVNAQKIESDAAKFTNKVRLLFAKAVSSDLYDLGNRMVAYACHGFNVFYKSVDDEVKEIETKGKLATDWFTYFDNVLRKIIFLGTSTNADSKKNPTAGIEEAISAFSVQLPKFSASYQNNQDRTAFEQGNFNIAAHLNPKDVKLYTDTKGLYKDVKMQKIAYVMLGKGLVDRVNTVVKPQ